MNTVPHWMVWIQLIGGFLDWFSGADQATKDGVTTEWCWYDSLGLVLTVNDLSYLFDELYWLLFIGWERWFNFVRSMRFVLHGSGFLHGIVCEKLATLNKNDIKMYLKTYLDVDGISIKNLQFFWKKIFGKEL